MSIINKENLKKFFQRGKYPTESQFASLIDSFFHREEKILKEEVEGLIEALSSKAEADAINRHALDKDNPHNVTATQVGLGLVNNTADLEKPISLAMRAALDAKTDDAEFEALQASVSAHVSDVHNPHNVTATQVGLGLVDNTADLDKPISVATQAALNAKETPEEAQIKATNALTTAKAYADVLVGRLIDSSPDALDTLQELATALGNDPNFATTMAAQIGLKADKTHASNSTDGLMSFVDKIKIDSIASGAEVNVQSNWAESSAASDAFIKNKPASMPASDVFAWAKAANKPSYTASEVGASPNTHNHSGAYVEVGDKRLSDARPASDVYAWAKAANKPTYTASEVGVITPAYEAYKPSNGWSINLGSNFVLTNGIGWQKNWVFVASTETFTVTLPSTSSHYAPFVSKTFAGGVVEISVIKYATDIYLWSYLQIK